MAQKNIQDYLVAALVMAGLVVALFGRQLINQETVVATDLIFQLDPLWRESAPPAFTIPDNELISDQVYVFYPWLDFTFSSLREGEFPPLWNPYNYAGAPFFANYQPALFSPFRLLSYAFPLASSFLVLAMTTLFTAGYGTYLFAREIRLSHTAALLAMLTFAFSGPIMVWLLYPMSLTFAWLPLLLWASERMLKKRTWAAAVLPAIFVGAQFMGGNPEASFYISFLWACYLAFRLLTAVPLRPFPGWWREQRGLLSKIIAVGGGGFLLAAVHMLPFIAYLPNSSLFWERLSEENNFWQAIFLSWQRWPDLVTMVFPLYFGTPVNRSHWYPYANYAGQTVYFGLLPLLMVGVTAVTTRRQQNGTARFFLVAALLFLGAAIQFPLLAGITKLPFFNISMPDRLKLDYAFCIAITAGYGWDTLQRHWADADFAPLWRQLRLAGLLLGLGGLVVILGSYLGLGIFRETILEMGRQQAVAAKETGNILFFEPLDFYLQRVELQYGRMRALFTLQNPAMFLPVVVGGLTVLAVQLRRRGRAVVWGYLLLVVTAVDLLAVHSRYFPSIPADEIYPPPTAIDLPADPTPYRAVGLNLAMMPNSNMVVQLPDIRGYAPLTPRRTLDLLRSSPGYYRIGHYALFTQPDDPFFDMMGVRYILSPQPIDTDWSIMDQSAGGLTLYDNETAQPRVRLLTEAILADSAEESLRLFNSADFDGGRQIILEGTISGAVTPAAGDVGAAVITQENSDMVEISTNAAQPAYLLLTDTHMPGWEATIDGEPAPILIANHAFRAVELPAGEQTVRFRYRPLSVRVGAGISLAAWALLLLAVVGTIAARRR